MQRKEERSAGAGPAGNVCYVIYRVPREPGAGIIISKENHPGSVFFKIPNAGWILCPDEVRLRVLDLGLTNVDFLEYGEFV
jgi:hypothetical protein